MAEGTHKHENQQAKTTAFNLNRKIFVRSIGYKVNSHKLEQFFSKFGPVEHCHIVIDHLKKKSKGMAFVTFKDEESMKKALDAPENELILYERQMSVYPAELSPKVTYWQNVTESDTSNSVSESTKQCDAVVNDDVVDTSLAEVRENKALESSSTTTILDLHDELLLRIFSLLHWKNRIAIERVCWKWKHLIDKTWVYVKSLTFGYIFERFQSLTDKMLNSILLRCGQYIESLDFSASPWCLTNFALDIIAKHSPGIKHLNLAGVAITDISVDHLVAECVNIHKLWLNRCLYITDKGVHSILSSCPHLQYLNLSDLQLSGKCFKNVGTLPLKYLLLTGNKKLSDHGIRNLTRHCKELEELHISNCSNLTSDSFTYICQELTKIKIFQAEGLKVGNATLINNLPNLEEINVSYSCDISDNFMLALSVGCKKLRSVDIGCCYSVSDVGVMALTDLPELSSVNLSYLNQVTESSFYELAQRCWLKKVIVRATSFVNDEAVLHLLSCCHQLEYLDLSGCLQISDYLCDGIPRTLILDSQRSVELILGGTAIEMDSVYLERLVGLAQINVSMNNFACHNLRHDGTIILPEPIDDWNDNEDEIYDNFLDNDDPVSAERWHMS